MLAQQVKRVYDKQKDLQDDFDFRPVGPVDPGCSEASD